MDDNDARKSVTFTALVFFGMIVALAGVVIVALGLGGSTSFDLSIGDIEAKTTSSGLAVLAVGAALSALVALNLPEGVQVFAPSEATLASRLRKIALPAAVLSVGAVLALIASVLLSW